MREPIEQLKCFACRRGFQPYPSKEPFIEVRLRGRPPDFYHKDCLEKTFDYFESRRLTRLRQELKKEGISKDEIDYVCGPPVPKELLKGWVRS